MAIPQLKNPKQLSYSGMRKQVRELARRMNILTEMRTVSVEPTATAKFTFSGDDATLDVPSVEEAVDLAECEEALAECEEALPEALKKIADLINDFCVDRQDKERGLIDGEIYLMGHSGSGNRTAYSPSLCPGSNCPPIPVWVTFSFYKVSTGANAPGYFRIEAGYVNGFNDHLVISTADSVASIIHTAAYPGSPSYYAEYNSALAGTTVYAGFNVNGFAEYVSLGSFRYPDAVNDIPVDLCAEEETEL